MPPLGPVCASEPVGPSPVGLLKEQESRAVRELQQVVQADPLLRDSGLSHGFYLKCLRARSWVVEEAALVARNFVSFRRSVSWPLELKQDDVTAALGVDAHLLLPGRDSEGRGILVFFAGRVDPSRATAEQLQMEGVYLMERATDQLDIQEQGVVIVISFKDITLQRLLAFSAPRDMRRGTMAWKDAFPCKLKAILIHGAPRFVTPVLKAARALLSRKLRDRIRIIAKDEEFEQVVDMSQLPPELGGTLQYSKEEMVRHLAGPEQ